MDRPKISDEATEVKWKTFLNDWRQYKSSQNMKKNEDKKMQLCKYNLACNVENCTHDHNYGDILVEEAMIANMYNQDNMTRIMLDHKITNTFDLKYEMLMTIQESGECARELIGASSTSHRRSDYKAQQAAGQRGAIPKKLDQNSKEKSKMNARSHSRT